MKGRVCFIAPSVSAGHGSARTPRTRRCSLVARGELRAMNARGMAISRTETVTGPEYTHAEARQDGGGVPRSEIIWKIVSSGSNGVCAACQVCQVCQDIKMIGWPWPKVTCWRGRGWSGGRVRFWHGSGCAGNNRRLRRVRPAGCGVRGRIGVGRRAKRCRRQV